MASSGELDLAYLVAALVEEYGGELRVSEDWFTQPENPFAGARLAMNNVDGVITITLEEEGE